MRDLIKTGTCYQETMAKSDNFCAKTAALAGLLSSFFMAVASWSSQAAAEIASFEEVANWRNGVAVFEVAGSNVRVRSAANKDADVVASIGGKRGSRTVIAATNVLSDASGKKWREVSFISTSSEGCSLKEPPEMGADTGKAFIADDFLKHSVSDENGCIDAALAKKFGVMDFSKWIAVDSPYLARFVLGRDASISFDGLPPETVASGTRLAAFGSTFLSVSGIKSGTLFLELGGGYYQRLGDADMEKILALPVASGKDKLITWSKGK